MNQSYEKLSSFRTFIFAATDTTTGALSRIIHLLSLHPEVQDRLREEVITARKEHGDLDYDSLQALPFLDAVCRETMRVYPPAVQITRQYVDLFTTCYLKTQILFKGNKRRGSSSSLPNQSG